MILKSRLKIFFFHFLQIIICFETCGLLCQPLLDNGSGGCSVQGTTTGVVEIEMSESTRSDNANETTTMAKSEPEADHTKEEENDQQSNIAANRHNNNNSNNSSTVSSSCVVSNGAKKPLDLSNQDELISPEKTSKRRKQDSSGQSCTMAALQEAAGFPASSYLQSFAAIPANYGNYFASVDYANGTGYAGNPYLPGGAYDLPLLSNSDRARLLENSIKRLENDVLTKSLFQIDSIALKQLIVGYRDAAALLNRTADELEHFVSTKH
ncbi:hypothetical protein T12_5049 [Trichinella patagoniensis]|uniref:Uncharacterized protein n=1 Tax=Trichinella patagoniensis TaxID=990121 RepID=A0A0V0ZAV5_9BILA|nr:hypothetical protein T12_5049 [Trichinella patagoniensis]